MMARRSASRGGQAGAFPAALSTEHRGSFRADDAERKAHHPSLHKIPRGARVVLLAGTVIVTLLGFAAFAFSGSFRQALLSQLRPSSANPSADLALEVDSAAVSRGDAQVAEEGIGEARAAEGEGPSIKRGLTLTLTLTPASCLPTNQGVPATHLIADSDSLACALVVRRACHFWSPIGLPNPSSSASAAADGAADTADGGASSGSGSKATTTHGHYSGYWYSMDGRDLSLLRSNDDVCGHRTRQLPKPFSPKRFGTTDKVQEKMGIFLSAEQRDQILQQQCKLGHKPPEWADVTSPGRQLPRYRRAVMSPHDSFLGHFWERVGVLAELLLALHESLSLPPPSPPPSASPPPPPRASRSSGDGLGGGVGGEGGEEGGDGEGRNDGGSSADGGAADSGVEESGAARGGEGEEEGTVGEGSEERDGVAVSMVTSSAGAADGGAADGGAADAASFTPVVLTPSPLTHTAVMFGTDIDVGTFAGNLSRILFGGATPLIPGRRLHWGNEPHLCFGEVIFPLHTAYSMNATEYVRRKAYAWADARLTAAVTGATAEGTSNADGTAGAATGADAGGEEEEEAEDGEEAEQRLQQRREAEEKRREEQLSKLPSPWRDCDPDFRIICSHLLCLLQVTWLYRSNRRTITNVGDVLQLLTAHFRMPIHIIELSESTPFDQVIHTMRHTAFAIGMHGSALANLIFLPSGASALELIPYKYRYFPYLPPPSTMCPAGLTKWFDQVVHTMRHTAFAMGMHGSALANLIFLPSGASALELIPYKYRYFPYLTIAPLFNINYHQWTNEKREFASFDDGCFEGKWAKLSPSDCWKLKPCLRCVRDHARTHVDPESIGPVLADIGREVRIWIGMYGLPGS
ncbi:unnamed protein product [Closterium sp. NIES-64]|nr:unnamed protein product [Closterium sp. NIES-64]